MSGFRINLKPLPSALPVPEEEEYYSSWSLFLVCVLLVLSLWTSYYLQIKKIKTIHETLVSIFAGMVVGLIVRLAPGTMIRDMLVSVWSFFIRLRAAWFSALRLCLLLHGLELVCKAVLSEGLISDRDIFV